MKLSHITIILATIVGAVAATPLGGNGDERSLVDYVMDESDFKTLWADYYGYKDDPCQFIFKVPGFSKTSIDVDTKIEVKDNKIVCRLKGGKANKYQDYGVDIPMRAYFDLSGNDVIAKDENGDDYDVKSGTKVEWFKQSDGAVKIKLTIKIDSDGGDPDPPECDDEEDNEYKNDCAYKTKDWDIDRPSNDFVTDTFTVKCPSSPNNEPMYYIFGTSDKKCDEDKVCSCEAKNGKVSCDVHVSEKTSDCKKDDVKLVAHVLCC